MKFNGSIAAGPGRINKVLSWIWIIVRIQEPDLHRSFEFQRDISQEVMDKF